MGVLVTVLIGRIGMVTRRRMVKVEGKAIGGVWMGGVVVRIVMILVLMGDLEMEGRGKMGMGRLDKC